MVRKKMFERISLIHSESGAFLRHLANGMAKYVCYNVMLP